MRRLCGAIAVLVLSSCSWDWNGVERAIGEHAWRSDAGPLRDAGEPFGDLDARIADGHRDAHVQTPTDAQVEAGATWPSFDAGELDASATDDDAGNDDTLRMQGCALEDRPAGSASLAAARALADGPTTMVIEHVLVTYVLPALGGDPAGFFVQAEAPGPALFVSVNPTSLSPRPRVGDCVRFDVRSMETFTHARHVGSLAAYAVIGTQHPVAGLVQDVSSVVDLISDPVAYESELARGTGQLGRCQNTVSGSTHLACSLLTTGLPVEGSFFRLRVPSALGEALDVVEGCTVTVESTPLWRHSSSAAYANPQLSAWRRSDLTLSACPPPAALEARALSATSIRVSFDRHISPASLLGDGTQFASVDGPGILGAALEAPSNGASRSILLTTSAQHPGAHYTLDIDGTLTDTLGSPAASTALELRGYGPPARLLINEVEYGACDRVELRVVQGGSLNGYGFRTRAGEVARFDDLFLQTNDLIVLHLCGSQLGVNESASPDEQPTDSHPEHFDTAYDRGPSTAVLDVDLNHGSEVLVLYDRAGVIVDAMLLSNANTPSAEALHLSLPVLAMQQWSHPDGSTPALGFDASSFVAAAVPIHDLAPGASMQRIRDLDTHTRNDWDGVGALPTTLGSKNVGQEAL